MDSGKTRSVLDNKNIISYIKNEIAERKGDRVTLLLDLLVFTLAFFLSKRHIAFGVYPLGITLVGVMNGRVFIFALGAIISMLSLGGIGVIYAIMIPLVVFIRLILSYGKEDGIFREPYVVRIFAVAISSSLVSLYELLVSGATLNATLFASLGILLPVGIGISLFGVFTSNITYKDILYSHPLAIRHNRELQPSLVFFHASALLLLLLSTLALLSTAFFGINLSHIFLSAVTIFISVRFGFARGMLVGFFAGLALGGLSAVGFAIAGLVVALLIKLGVGYAVIGSIAIIGAWCGYVGGVSEFLSVFPEYSITATLMLPFLKSSVKAREESHEENNRCDDPHLSLILERLKGEYNSDIAERISTLSSAVNRFSSSEGVLEFSEYRNIILAVTSEINPPPCEEIIDALASKFYKGERLLAPDIIRILGVGSEGVAEKILKLNAEYERECFVNARQTGIVGEYERVIKLLKENKRCASQSIIEDKPLTDIIRGELRHLGIEYSSAVVVGIERKHIIIICDKENKDSLSDKLISALTSRLGRAIINISCEESYGAAVFLGELAPLFMAEYGIRTLGSGGGDVSGDSGRVRIADARLNAILSDGVGKGRAANDISSFILEYLFTTLCESDTDTRESLSTLSSILRTSRNEASGTADILSINLYTGKGYFIKCGAISSYIIRENKVIEINGGGAPLGLVGTPITESGLVEIIYGDTIIMLSDGFMPGGDISYLTKRLSIKPCESAEEIATEIVNFALSQNKIEDDITALVIKILPYSQMT